MKHADSTIFVNWIVHSADDLAIWVWWIDVRQVLGHGLTGNCQRIAVQKACVKQRLHYNWDATDPVNIVHHILTKRLQVSKVWNLVSNPVEIFELQINLSLTSNR